MASYRIAINGFGRIGRLALRAMFLKKGLEIVAINDLTDPATLAHLYNYDTVYRAPVVKADIKSGQMVIGKNKISVFSEKDPALLPWKKLKIDCVLECTGRFTDKQSASAHLVAGAKKVIISAPGKGDIPTLVIGVNEASYAGETVVDNASCTTNSAAPMMKVLEENFGVVKAMLTTIHSYTADQNLQDGPHRDWRRARAAAGNIVPTSTGAALAVAKTIPSLKGKFDGLSVRVPTQVVSLTDMTVLLKKNVTVEEINSAMRKASTSKSLKGILNVTDLPLVSSDFIGSPASVTVDLPLTNVVDGNLVKVVGWYDNEWGYANRLVELAAKISQKK